MRMYGRAYMGLCTYVCACEHRSCGWPEGHKGACGPFPRRQCMCTFRAATIERLAQIQGMLRQRRTCGAALPSCNALSRNAESPCTGARSNSAAASGQTIGQRMLEYLQHEPVSDVFSLGIYHQHTLDRYWADFSYSRHLRSNIESIWSPDRPDIEPMQDAHAHILALILRYYSC